MSRRQFPLSAAERAPCLLRNWEMSLRFVPGISSKVAFSTAGLIALARLNVFELRRVIQICSFGQLSGGQWASLPGAGVWLAVTLALKSIRPLWMWGDWGRGRVLEPIQAGFEPNHCHSLGKLFNLSLNLLFLFCEHRVTPLHWVLGTVKRWVHFGCSISLLVRTRLAIRKFHFDVLHPCNQSVIAMCVHSK